MSLVERFPRHPLTFGPTPIEHLPRLSKALGGQVAVYAKRDDCNSGLAMGRNKLRKLEYIIPDAIASGSDTLVSIGGVQSNHTRMVAAAAAKIPTTRLTKDSAHKIMNGVPNDNGPTMAAFEAATPKISTGTVSGSTSTASSNPPRRRAIRAGCHRPGRTPWPAGRRKGRYRSHSRRRCCDSSRRRRCPSCRKRMRLHPNPQCAP